MAKKSSTPVIDEEDDIFEYDISDEDENFYMSAALEAGEGQSLVECLPKHVEQRLSEALPACEEPLGINRQIERNIIEVNVDIDALSAKYDKALGEFEEITMSRMLSEDDMGFDEETKLLSGQSVDFEAPQFSQGETVQMEDARGQAAAIWEQLSSLEMRRSNLYGQRNRVLLSIAAKVLVSDLDKADKDSALREITSLVESAKDIQGEQVAVVSDLPAHADVSVVPQRPQQSVLFNETVKQMGFDPSITAGV